MLSSLPHSSQWPEGRAFERMYGCDPWRQANFVQNLLGLRAFLEDQAKATPEVIEAVDVVVSAFAEQHPDHLLDIDSRKIESDLGRDESYSLDQRLMNMLGELGVIER